jgi:hypothetical protein
MPVKQSYQKFLYIWAIIFNKIILVFMEAQKRLFDIIRSQIPDQYRIADIIEELLGISTDSAYRRIRGEKDLSFSELEKLCRHFRLSVDEVLNASIGQGAFFQHTSVDMADQSSYIHYIKRLSATLLTLRHTDDCEMFFTAQDIPFYHFLKHTELLFFKLYVWHDVINPERISFRTFCDDRLDQKNILPIYEQMCQSYMQIPSSEIWTNQTVDTILRLLDFYMEIGAFDSKEMVLRLLNSLSQLLDTVNDCAVNGHKGDKRQTPFSLYACSVDLENNFMLTRHGDRRVCTIKLYTVNSVATDNEAVCRETGKWINDLMLKSTLISGQTSGRERFRFFRTAKNKVSELTDKVEKMNWAD